jgi:purine-cytosine permease-like protein
VDPQRAVGLCFVNLPGQFVGPLGELAGGIDLSLPVTLGLAGVLYLICSTCSLNLLACMARKARAGCVAKAPRERP